nr:C69 family dipeptidase [Brachybacterium sp. FME24]
MNGIAFSDEQDIWWLETVGGHHWIARRVTEDYYVTMPNQLGVANSLHIVSVILLASKILWNRPRILNLSSRIVRVTSMWVR